MNFCSTSFLIKVPANQVEDYLEQKRYICHNDSIVLFLYLVPSLCAFDY